MVKKGLGRGLSSLFGSFEGMENDPSVKEPSKIEIIEKNEKSIEIPIGEIDRNEEQPRKNFDEKALAELAISIKNYGVVQPIILVKKNNRYMIIAGERRWRAARMAGLKTIPAVIREYTPQEISEIAIIENLQREDLNPIESAMAIQDLKDKYNMTQEEVADKIGKSRSAVTNTLRLLTLPNELIELVKNNKLSAGHARALLVVEDKELQLKLAKEIYDKKLSVREVEKLIKELSKPKKHKLIPEKSLELRDFEEKLNRRFTTKVSIQGGDKKGKIIIEYFNKQDLERIYDLLNN